MVVRSMLRNYRAHIVLATVCCSCFEPREATEENGGTEGETSDGTLSTSPSSTSEPTASSASGITGAASSSEGGDELGSTSAGMDDGPDGSSGETGEVPPPGCGNGIDDPDEACDDGNDDNTDACTHLCRAATCGDGWTQPVNEEVCEPGEVPEGSCWAEGEEWGGVLACASTCDATTTETCLQWRPIGSRLSHGVELGPTGLEFDAAGNAHALYSSRDAASNRQLYTVRYDAETASWGTPVPLVRLGAMVAEPFYVQSSALAVAPSGAAFLAYSLSQGGVTPYDVYVARFDPETAVWGTPARVGGGDYVAIDVGSSEQAVLLWQDADYQATFARYTPEGGTWSSPARLSASLADLSANNLFVDDDGRAFSMTSSAGRLYFSALDTEWSHTPLTPTLSSFSPSPIAGAARHGSALLGYGRLDNGEGLQQTDVYVLDPTSGVVGEPTAILDAYSFRLAMGDAGHGALAYWENSETWYLRRLLPGARTFEDPLAIPTVSAIDHLTVDAEGNIIVFGNNENFGTVHALRFDAAAEAWSAPVDAFVPGENLFSGALRSDIHDSGQLILAVTEGPGGRAPDNDLLFRHLR